MDQDRYRFLCKKHAQTVNSSGRSEWYLNRLRLRRMMYRKGLLVNEDETKTKKVKSDE